MVAKSKANGTQLSWPKECVWPKPSPYGASMNWEAEDLAFIPIDDEASEFVEIKEYMDGLVEEGRLREDFTKNPDFDWAGEEGTWEPEMGEDYWSEEGFDLWFFDVELTEHMNLLKLDYSSPVDDIERVIGYKFVNENLLRQAFTRRSFANEHGVGDAELLEFIGDAALNLLVTKEMATQLTKVNAEDPSKSFSSRHSEGDLSKIRSHYICKENLAGRARALDLGQYVLLGSGEELTDSVLEDTLEAVVGAVAVDSKWDWTALENVADQILTIQLQQTYNLVRPSFYDRFNAWHQRKFSCLPDYEVSYLPYSNDSYSRYSCTLRFFVPKNDKGVHEDQRVDVSGESRGKARELAAERAYWFVMSKGLWMRLEDANIVPDPEASINQLQELYQKGYVEEPSYTIEEDVDIFGESSWECRCVCSGAEGVGRARRKVHAKKKAAFMSLVRLLKGAGICKPEWENMMWVQVRLSGEE